MSIFAIDPAPEKSAYVFWESDSLREFAKVPNQHLLDRLRGDCGDALVIERVGHYGTGMPAGQTVFDTCHWSGRFHQAWLGGQARAGWFHGRDEDPVFLLRRQTVKAHFCGAAKARDSNIRQALIDRFGDPGTKKAPGLLYGVSGDCWQALALAVAFADGVR